MIKLRNGFSVILFIMLLLPLSSLLPATEAAVDEPVHHVFLPSAVADAYEDDDSFETASSISLNSMQLRSIYPIADPDYLVFTLDTFYDVEITTNTTVGDTTMCLYDYHQTPIIFDDNTGDDLNATISYDALKPGIYFLKIEESGNDAEIDDYSVIITATLLTFDPYEPDDCSGATFMTFNTSITKSIYPLTDHDIFTFTLTQNYNITAETFGTNGDTVIDLIEGDCDFPSVVEHNDDKGDGTLFSKVTHTNLGPGTYYIDVYGYDDNHLCWNYTLYLTAYSSAISDTTAPIITAITTTLSEPYGDCGANIDLISHDAWGIEEVKLFYRVNYGSWNNFTMWKGSFDHYLGALGPFSEGDFVQYYFISEDSSSNHNERTSDNGGSYYDFTVLHNDLSGPTITNVHHVPVAPNETETVLFNCTITDSNGIQYAILHYRINGAVWLGHSLTLDVNDNYIATRGPFTLGDFVEYYISAADDSTQHNSEINDNSGMYYSFTVTASDITGPSISDIDHDPVSPTDIQNVNVTCTVTDPEGIHNVTLHYRIDGGLWINTSMLLLSGDVYGIIIGTFDYDEQIEYFISARDDHVNHNLAIDDNLGLYYTFTILSGDITPPEITNIDHSPASPNDEDPVVFTCDVTDGSGLYSVYLYCRVNGGSWSYIMMAPTTGDSYSGGLGGLDYQDFVEYYVNATDDSPNRNFIVDDNGGLYYSFTVGTSDDTPPVINSVENNPIWPTELNSVNISCYVWDVNGISNVTLHYRVNSGIWTEVNMTFTSLNIYLVTLDPFIVGDGIEYYITAFDTIGNEATNDNSGQYYNFGIRSSVTTTTTPVTITYFIPLITMISLIVLIRKRK